VGGFIFNLDLSFWEWLLFFTCGIFIGMSKTGLAGAGLMVVPIMAGIFGGRNSVGIVLPMLIIADIVAVIYYNRHANWRYVFYLLPWALCGVFLGTLFGEIINDQQFKVAIAVIVITGIALMLWYDLRKTKVKVTDKWWFAAILGLTGGFTTMVGNAAGPVMALYLLSMNLPKNSFIGTGAWFFFIINILKIPFHIYGWETINNHSVFIDILVLPAILAGAFIGLKIVKLFPEKGYRIFIIASTLVSAIFLL